MCLAMLWELAGRCAYYEVCGDPSSATCTHGPQNYCGKYRKQEREKNVR